MLPRSLGGWMARLFGGRSQRRRREILELLSNGAWWTANELVDFSGGKIKLWNAHVDLRALEREGVIYSREDPNLDPHMYVSRGMRPRRQYRLAAADTAPGKRKIHS